MDIIILILLVGFVSNYPEMGIILFLFIIYHIKEETRKDDLMISYQKMVETIRKRDGE